MHELILNTVRQKLANELTPAILEAINIQDQLTNLDEVLNTGASPSNKMGNYAENLFEKDISEALGFSFG